MHERRRKSCFASTERGEYKNKKREGRENLQKSNPCTMYLLIVTSEYAQKISWTLSRNWFIMWLDKGLNFTYRLVQGMQKPQTQELQAKQSWEFQLPGLDIGDPCKFTFSWQEDPHDSFSKIRFCIFWLPTICLTHKKHSIVKLYSESSCSRTHTNSLFKKRKEWLDLWPFTITK